MNETFFENTDKHNQYLQLFLHYIVSRIHEALEHLIISALVYAVVCLSLYRLLFRRLGIILISAIRFPTSINRILIVTAHPDDECMFFGPTILSLCKRSNCEVFLLCLSTGNYELKGNIRKQELWNSCKVLNIKSENIKILNVTNLQDDPSVEWKIETISKLVINEIESLDIEAVITFDRDGVSQHPNHTAIYYAIASLCLEGLIPKSCRIFTLDTINIFRKYISLFDLPITFVMSTNRFILNWKEYKIVKKAMKQHKSQLVWYRKLYITFSRYMIINSLREMNLSDIELEMQL